MYAYRKQRTKRRSGGDEHLFGRSRWPCSGRRTWWSIRADGPIQVLVGSLLPGHQQEQKPNKQRIEPVQAAIPTTMNSIPKACWASLNSMQGSRNLDGDHKLPLSEGETKGPSQ